MKNFLLFGVFALLAHTASAQFKLLWQNCYGGWGSDYLYHAKPTLDGGYIAVGHTSKAGGDVTGPIRGQNDAWVIKTDSNGAPQWDTVLGGTGGDMAMDVCQTSDSGYLLLISSNSVDGDMVGGSFSGYDIWVAKLTAAGDLLWMHNYGGSGTETGQRLMPTPDGNYIVAATSTSSDGDISTAKGGQDIWVFKISAANGNIIWEHSYGGSGNETAADISPTTDLGFIICGTHNNTVNGDVTVAHGFGDMWVVKTDSAGNLTWQKTVGGTQYDGGGAVIPTFDGGYAAVGWTGSNDVDITGYHDSTDVLVARLTATGTLLWAKAIGSVHVEGGGFSSSSVIVQNRDSNLVISTLNRLPTGPNYNSNGIWLAVVDPAGNVTSELTLGGSSEEQNWSLEMVSDSTYILAVTTMSQDGDVSGGGFHSGPTSSRDGWLAKLKLPVKPLEVKTISAMAGVRVYPTYTTGLVNVAFDGAYRRKNIVLLNALGQLVHANTNINGDKATINMAGVAAGTYYLHINTDEKTSSYKIIYQP